MCDVLLSGTSHIMIRLVLEHVSYRSAVAH